MKKKQTNSKYYYIMLIVLLANVTSLFSQEKKTEKQTAKLDSLISNKKEEKSDRNVMMNAGASTGPRALNIGLPFQGDILIMENDIPVVYTFWPQIPTTVWNYNNSIGRIGLLSFAEGALTYGKVGYCVTSFDREASSKFKGYASAYTNSNGSFRYDACITGPIGKKGWGYMLSGYENYDRGNGTNFMFVPYSDRAEEFKAGISKKYKNGSIRLLYKHAEDRPMFMTTQPIKYLGNGKTTSIPNFLLGTDSYIVSDGKAPYYDYNTGEAKMEDISSDVASKFVANTFYLTGDHKFKSGLKFTYSSMYMHSLAPFNDQYPISLLVQDPDQRGATEAYTYAGTTNKYNGSVQLVSNQYCPQSPINTWISRVELAKKMNNHNVRVGVTQQNFDLSMVNETGLYYQTVEKNPKLLDRYYDAGAYGLFPVTTGSLLPNQPGQGMGSYQKLDIHKLALYFSDDMDLTPWLSAGIGGRIEKEDDRETHYQYQNQFQLDRPLLTQDFNNKYNKVGVASLVVKATKNFGFIGDITYNDWYNRFWDYPETQKDALGNPVTTKDAAGNPIAQTTVAKDKQLIVINMGAGIYYNNGSLISLVSKITKITKKNNVTGATITNPADVTQTSSFGPLFYDISTIGWSTDVISTPMKNLNLHVLVTLQKPQYKNYSISAFGVTYDYNQKIVPALSQFLGEFDANYSLTSSLSFFASLRYFGKQYGNMTNSIYYNGWFENFGGATYRVSRNLDFKLQVVNFLNQRGVSGALQGADQITDAMATQYINRAVNASAIRPRTVEFTANFKF